MSETGLHKKSFKSRVQNNYEFWLFCLPGLILTFIFSYIPIYGILIAFKDYSASKGITGSPWTSMHGFKHFVRFVKGPYFAMTMKNTFILSIYSLVAGFPIPIILALLLNSFNRQRYKKVIQSVTYAPNFISTVVMAGMIILFLSPSSGVINSVFKLFGQEPVNFMAKPSLWRHIYVWSGVWQSSGWSAVIYIAALSSVNPELHEAAVVDGANKWQIIRYVDFPSILPTAIILLILNFGSIMSVGFEKAYLLQNDLNLPVSEIISTYVYKVGMIDRNMSYSTAIGLFNSVINAVLLLSVNKIADKVSGNSLW